MLSKIIRFVSVKQRAVQKLSELVDDINALEEEFEALSNEALAAKTVEFRERLAKEKPWTTSCRKPLPPGARGQQAHHRPAPLRRAADRRDGPAPGQDRRDAHRRRQDAGRHAAALPECPAGRGVHLVTVNDYLARRDARWMAPSTASWADRWRAADGRPHRERQARPSLSTLKRPRRTKTSTRCAWCSARKPTGRHHLRHQQRVRLRLPARQHGHAPGRARPARPLLRHRGRGGQRPDR